MRVRCTGIPDFRSNAVGSVELEPTPEGLFVFYLSAGSYREGYAPGPATTGTSLCVPWPGVVATRLADDRLLVSLDERLTPLSRLLLSNFSRPKPPPSAEHRRRRRMVRAFSASAIALTLVFIAILLPEAAPNAGAAVALGIAGSAALLILLVGVAADQWLSAEAPEPSNVLEQLCLALDTYLPVALVTEEPTATPPTWTLDRLQALLPRSAVGIAITLSASSLAALLTTARHEPTHSPQSIALALDPQPTTTAARSATAPQPRNPSTSDPPPTEASPTVAPEAPKAGAIKLGAECSCNRHDSALWRTPLPRLSPLLIAQRSRPHAGHQHIDLQLAVVNNGDQTLRRLQVSVAFYERKPGIEGRGEQMVERPLYFEGPLGPGRAIKWQVEGRGTSFEVLAPDLGTLDTDGSNVAPADAFAALTDANHRPVRLHAAMMLAFLQDPRARTSTLELHNALRQEEGPYLDRVLHSTGELSACQLEVAPTQVAGQHRITGCAYNRTDQPIENATLRLQSLSDTPDPHRPTSSPPLVLAHHTETLAGSLPAKAGRQFEFSAGLRAQSDQPARSHEVIIAREGTLR